MDERLKFIARVLDGEKMAQLCREFGISRKTGYKILTRYRAIGLDGLTDRSRRPYRHANQLPVQIETLIVRLKRDKPSWGAPKIREKLSRLYPDVHLPPRRHTSPGRVTAAVGSSDDSGMRSSASSSDPVGAPSAAASRTSSISAAEKPVNSMSNSAEIRPCSSIASSSGSHPALSASLLSAST